MYVLYSTLLHLRFQCVGGRWNRTTRLDLIHHRLHLSFITRLDLIHNRLDVIHSRLDLIHSRIYSNNGTGAVSCLSTVKLYIYLLGTWYGTAHRTHFKKSKRHLCQLFKNSKNLGWGGRENFMAFKRFPGIPTLQRKVFYPASRKTLYFYS